MRTCIKDLFDYDLVKKCCRCKNILLKLDVLKDNKKKDGLQPRCISCCKEYYLETRDLLINKKKLYDKQNRNKINTRMNEYFRNRKQSDLNFKLVCNLRSRTSKFFKAQNVRKTNKTFDLLGCSHSFFQRWIFHHLYGNEIIENYGSVWQIDHCLAIASFNLLDEKEMKKCFNWINLRPMYCSENISKGDKMDYHLYLCQEVKAKYFMKLNVREG